MRFGFGAMVAVLAVACGSGGSGGGPTEPVPSTPELGEASVEAGLFYCGTEIEAQTLDLYLPPRPRAEPVPLVVYVHGGAWRVGSKREGTWFLRVARALIAEGFAVASLDYRLAPLHVWPAQIEDVRCAVSFLTSTAPSRGIDPDRVGMWGTSAGAHLAGVATLEDRISPTIRAFAGLYGIYDLTRSDLSDLIRIGVVDAFGEPPGPGLADASPTTLASSDDPPVFLVHGIDDSLVPVEQSIELRGALGDAGADSELLLVENAEHQLEPVGQPIAPSAASITTAIVEFFVTRL